MFYNSGKVMFEDTKSEEHWYALQSQRNSYAVLARSVALGNTRDGVGTQEAADRVTRRQSLYKPFSLYVPRAT